MAVKYIEERNKKTFALLDEAKKALPGFCNRFFLGISQVTAPLTRLNYAYDLKLFFEFLITEVTDFVEAEKKMSNFDIPDLGRVDVLHLEMFIDYLAMRGNNERAIMRKLSCLRTFFKYFFKKGEIKSNVLPNVDLPKLHEKSIIRLDRDEVAKIIKESSDGDGLTKGQRRFHSKLNMRDTAILTFFLSTGVRVSELVGLNVGDIDLNKGSFRVTRKGGNESVLYMTEELKTIMNEYMKGDTSEASAIEGLADNSPNAPLFVSLQGTRIGVRAVQNLVKKYAALASPLKKISPHKLRSTFGTNLYRATGDIYVVADVLGHRDVNTTKKHYAAMDEDIRKQAAKQLGNLSNTPQ